MLSSRDQGVFETGALSGSGYMRMLAAVIGVLGVVILASAAQAGQSGSSQPVRTFAAAQTPTVGQGRSVLSHRSKVHVRKAPFRLGHGRRPIVSGAIVPPFSGTIVPPFTVGDPIARDRLFKKRHPFEPFFITGFVERRTSPIVVIVQPLAVPLAPPAPPPPAARPQIVDLQPSPNAGEVQVFMPTPAPPG